MQVATCDGSRTRLLKSNVYENFAFGFLFCVRDDVRVRDDDTRALDDKARARRDAARDAERPRGDGARDVDDRGRGAGRCHEHATKSAPPTALPRVTGMMFLKIMSAIEISAPRNMPNGIRNMFATL